MARFTFSGFPELSSVAISVAQGGETSSGATPAWGARSGSFSIDILRRTEFTAPCTIWFGISGQTGFGGLTANPPAPYDPLYHEIEYFWNFGDPGTFSPPLETLNIPVAWRDSGVSKGPQATHTFQTPGTYDVEVLAVSPDGTTGLQTVRIEVKAAYGNADPADDYERIIAFSLEGDFTEAPPETTDQVTSWAALDQLFSSFFGMPRTLILWRRGEVYPNGSLSNGDFCRKTGTMRWSHYGTDPAMPEILQREDGTSAVTVNTYGNRCTWQEFVIDGLKMTGSWNPATYQGRDATVMGTYIGMDTAKNWGWSFNRCHFSGMANCNNETAAAGIGDVATCWNECVGTNWQSAGMSASTNQNNTLRHHLSIIGCMFFQNPDTPQVKTDFKPDGNPNGSLDKIGVYFGVARFNMQSDIVIDASYLFSNYGYTGPQGLRMNGATGPALTEAERIAKMRHHVYRTVVEGGPAAFSYEKGSPGNIVWDTCLLCGSADTNPALITTVTPLTLRGSYLLNPATDALHSFFGEFIMSSGTVSTYLDMPFRIYGNTALGLRSDAQNRAGVGSEMRGFLRDNLDPYSALIEENNVVVTPNQETTPVNINGPVDLSEPLVGFTPKHRGEWVIDVNVTVGSFATTVSPGQSYDFAYPAGHDQTYFLANEDAESSHSIQYLDGGAKTLRSAAGEIEVAFLPTIIRVTNTSSRTWPAGKNFMLYCDQSPSWPAHPQTSATPAVVPLPRPAPGSEAIDGAGQGLVPLTYLDLSLREGTVHPDAPGGTADRGVMPAI